MDRDYELLANGIKNESDVSRQVGIVDEMVAAGVDAIVIAPADSKVLIPALQKAKNAGVVIVNIDNRLDTEFMAKVGVSIPFVGPRQSRWSQEGRRFLGQQTFQDRQSRNPGRQNHSFQRSSASAWVRGRNEGGRYRGRF